MNFYPKHIGDWRAATAKLSLVEEAVYSRLVDEYYEHERPLPLDPHELERIVRTRNSSERHSLTYVVATFFERSSEGYRHKRCENEIAMYKKRQNQAQQAAQTRWGMRTQDPSIARASGHEDATASPEHMPATCSSNANQEPRTKNQEEPKTESANDDNGQPRARARSDGSASSSPAQAAIDHALRKAGARRTRDARRRIGEVVALGATPWHIADARPVAERNKPKGFTANYLLGIVLNRFDDGTYGTPMASVDAAAMGHPLGHANGSRGMSRRDRDDAFMAAITRRGQGGEVIDVNATEVSHVAEKRGA